MFEQTLRSIRQARNMTQQELAEQLFVSRQTVSSWETGRNLPNLETLARLAELLNVSTDYLLGRQPKISKSLRLTCLPTVLAIMAIVRFAIATSVENLWLSDGVISLLLGLLFAPQWLISIRKLNFIAMVLGLLMIAASWGQILGMEIGNQLGYIVVGALLFSESTWLIGQNSFHLRSGFMNSKSWWITNAVFSLLSISGMLWILIRRVDGAGHVEDWDSRLLALSVLGIVIVAIVIVELMIYLIGKKARKPNR